LAKSEKESAYRSSTNPANCRERSSEEENQEMKWEGKRNYWEINGLKEKGESEQEARSNKVRGAQNVKKAK